MDDFDRFIARFPREPGVPTMHELRISAQLRIEDDQGNVVLDLDRKWSHHVDNGPLLKTIAKDFTEMLDSCFVRHVRAFFRALVDRIADSVVSGEKPDLEFPEHMRGPPVASVHWNKPVRRPAYEPTGLIPMPGAHSRGLWGNPPPGQ